MHDKLADVVSVGTSKRCVDSDDGLDTPEAFRSWRADSHSNPTRIHASSLLMLILLP